MSLGTPFAQEVLSVVEFSVAGVPAPQGSKTRTKWGVREDNPATKPWRTAVAWEATAAMQGRTPLAGPLELAATFYFPRPKNHYGTGKNSGRLKDNAPVWCGTKPDADKLLRAIGDAITGIVCRDDSQIVQITAWKLYGTPSAEITVRPAQGIAKAIAS
jgi:Holliday junction resolvase RusA-like endonuclease